MVLHSGELAEGGVCPIKRPHSSHLANLPLCQHLHRLTAPHNQHWSKSHECIFSMRTICRFQIYELRTKAQIYCFIWRNYHFTPYIQNSYMVNPITSLMWKQSSIKYIWEWKKWGRKESSTPNHLTEFKFWWVKYNVRFYNFELQFSFIQVKNGLWGCVILALSSFSVFLSFHRTKSDSCDLCVSKLWDLNSCWRWDV